MSAAQPARARPDLEAAVERIHAALAPGLTAEQVAWALSAYRAVVLPPRLDVELVSQAEREEWVRSIVGEITAGWSEAWPEAKWTAVRADYYLARLAPLSRAAFELARRAHEGADLERVRTEAQSVRDTLSALVAEIDATSAAVRDLLAFEVSEAELDCRYAIERTPFYSLRLGHLISEIAATQPGQSRSDDPIGDEAGRIGQGEP